MANRHSNKKLRREVRRRMASSGESYQQALLALRRDHGQPLGVDLIAANYFGMPITLAVYDAVAPIGRPIVLRVPSYGAGPFSRMPLPFMNFRPGGCQ